jgi:hypothetical protein
MPMHDWTRVPPGIFHAFHHGWISAIAAALNAGKLPDDYYALPEQIAGGLGPDVLTLQGPGDADDSENGSHKGAATAVRKRPHARFIAESDGDYYRRKKSWVAIRHISGDRIVAVIEVVSPGNKSNRHAFEAFVDKACELLERRIHLLMVDPFPPGPRDPNGVHAAIWEAFEGASFELPPNEPLTLVSYECDLTTRAYIEPLCVGRPLPDMPLFLEPNEHVMAPLEETYLVAFADMPKRWRGVIEK